MGGTDGGVYWDAHHDDDLYHSVSLLLGVKYSSKTDCLDVRRQGAYMAQEEY